MENHEVAHIERNTPLLATKTLYRAMILSKLKSAGILTTEDIQKIHTEYDRNGEISAMAKFYGIIVGRENAFEPLKQVLEEERQTGALAILNSLPPPITLENIRLHESQQPVLNLRPIQGVVETPIQLEQVENADFFHNYRYKKADSVGSTETNDTDGTYPGYNLR